MENGRFWSRKGGSMQIFGIDISSKNFGLDQIYIRCMAGLSVLAGIIFPTYSSWASSTTMDVRGGGVSTSSIISGYYYRALVGAPGVTADVLEYYPSSDDTRCVSGYCFVDGQYTTIGCPTYQADPSHTGPITPAGYCYVNPSGVCGSAGCYPYFYAPLSVMQGLGCKSGYIAPSGEVRLDKCYYEAVNMSSVSYEIYCNSAYPNDPLPHSVFYIPYTTQLLHDKMVKSWGGAHSIGIWILEHGPHWIVGASGKLELHSATYDSNNYCKSAGCPAIWLTDASGGYTVSEGSYTSPIRNQYGTSYWSGTPDECTATLYSTQEDGTSSDPAGKWTISCTYSK